MSAIFCHLQLQGILLVSENEHVRACKRAHSKYVTLTVQFGENTQEISMNHPFQTPALRRAIKNKAPFAPSKTVLIFGAQSQTVIVLNAAKHAEKI